MNQWGESASAVNQYVGTAVDELGDLITWFRRDIVAKKRIPRNKIAQVNKSLTTLSEALQSLAGAVSGIADAQGRAMLTLLSGKRLNREEFYILLVTECVEWTNKTVGLSDFDDYELFNLLRYEGENRNGYIYLAADIDELPQIDPDDWTLSFVTRTYRKAIIPPEEIQWSTLNSEQRSFFENYLPETVGRFKHDE